MPVHLPKRGATKELDDALVRHLNILSDLQKWCIDENRAKEPFFYLLAIPIIYSAWEGYFRITCSICLRRLCHQGRRIRTFDHKYTTLWLQREGFVESFLQSLLNSMTPGRDSRKISPGRFNALAKFSENTSQWLDQPINHATNFDDLVMTYSNVNPEVAKLNCGIIGIDVTNVDFSKLNEIIERRNNIAHGGLIQYPRETNVVELIAYSRTLLNSFGGSVKTWIATT